MNCCRECWYLFINLQHCLATAAPAQCRLRWVKSPAELNLMRTSAAIAAHAQRRCMQMSCAGVHERQLATEFEYAVKLAGASRVAYPTMAGGGPDACTIHYSRNDKRVRLLQTDAGKTENTVVAVACTRTHASSWIGHMVDVKHTPDALGFGWGSKGDGAGETSQQHICHTGASTRCRLQGPKRHDCNKAYIAGGTDGVVALPATSAAGPVSCPYHGECCALRHGVMVVLHPSGITTPTCCAATCLRLPPSTSQVHGDQLLLMDAGCEFHGYASDVTRTWPVGGRFTPEQRRVYDIVLSVRQRYEGRGSCAVWQPAVGLQELCSGLVWRALPCSVALQSPAMPAGRWGVSAIHTCLAALELE